MIAVRARLIGLPAAPPAVDRRNRRSRPPERRARHRSAASVRRSVRRRRCDDRSPTTVRKRCRCNNPSCAPAPAESGCVRRDAVSVKQRDHARHWSSTLRASASSGAIIASICCKRRSGAVANRAPRFEKIERRDDLTAFGGALAFFAAAAARCRGECARPSSRRAASRRAARRASAGC